MFDIEDIGDSGEVRDDSKLKKGKVTNRKFLRRSTDVKGMILQYPLKQKYM